MSTANRWKAFILPYINKVMEFVRADSETSYEDWKKITKNYEDTVGKKYERGIQ